MYYRTNLQPDPMKDYELIDIYGNEYIGRWLVGRTYEGWYIKLFISDDKEGQYNSIYSQKELKIYGYKPLGSKHEFTHYIPRKLLDEAFYGHQAISDFRTTPEILSYI